MTQGQLTIVKNDIAADPTFSLVPQTSDGAVAIAEAYNLLASPTHWTYDHALAKEKLQNAESPDATLWNWGEYIALQLNEQNAYNQMFGINESVNMMMPNNRTGFAAIFDAGTSNRTHALAMARIQAMRIEALLRDPAEGPGTVVEPSTRTFLGRIAFTDIEQAWREG